MGIVKKFFSKLMLGNTMYFSGCTTRFYCPELEENYIKILDIFGIDFIRAPEFNCCGAPVLDVGHVNTFEDLKNQNLELLNNYNIKKMITNCPHCAKAFKEKYDLEVQTVLEILAENITSIKPVQDGEEITYHDPCILARDLNIVSEPRQILKALGFDVKEFPNNKDMTMCCGIGGGLKFNNPKMSKEIAKHLLMTSPTKRIVTSCPQCYTHLKEVANELNKGYEIFELSQLIVNKVLEEENSSEIVDEEMTKIEEF